MAGKVMTKAQLVSRIADKAGLTKSTANDILEIIVGVLEIAAIGNRQMKQLPDTGGVTYVVQKKSHIEYIIKNSMFYP